MQKRTAGRQNIEYRTAEVAGRMPVRTAVENYDMTACLALTAAVVLITLIFLALSGCQTAPTITILPGSDNVTVTATVVPEDLTFLELLPYAAMANEQAVEATKLYLATKDATTLEKLVYWTQYASGIALRLEQLSAATTP